MPEFAHKQEPTQKAKSASFMRPSQVFSGQSREACSIFNLQRTVGNHAVQWLLLVNDEESDTASAATTSTRFAHDFSRVPIMPKAPATIHPMLTVNSPGDRYEHEADRVADQVMRMPESRLQRTYVCGDGYPRCKKEGGTHQQLQIKHARANHIGKVSMPPIVQGAISASGSPLDMSTRRFMEFRFGHDLSQVRVHMGEESSKLNKSIGAKAFTVGNDIFFNKGSFKPESPEGKHLLAHELTHTLQQKGRGKRIQRLPSDWGDFKTPTYRTLKSNRKDIGADIKLEFHPNKRKVNAKKIGLVQTVDQKIGRWNEPMNPTKAEHTVKSGPGKGRAIDKRSRYRNPLYAANTAGPRDRLGDSPTFPSWGQHGWHYFDAAGAEKTQEAILIDQAKMGTFRMKKNQIFETAALAVEGVQAWDT